MANKEPTIRSEYKPSQTQKNAIEHVYNRKRDMESSKDRQAAVKQWERGMKQWEALREERNDDEWQSNHYVPLTTSVVETAMSEVIDQNPEPLILPGGSEDEPKALVMGHTFRYTWERAKSNVALFDILHDAFTLGTGIGQEFYWKDILKIKTERNKDGSYKFQEVKAYDDVYLEPVKLEDFLPDERGRGFDGPNRLRDCIRRYVMNIDDFKQFFKGEVWDPMGNAKYVIPGGDTNYYEWYTPPEGIDHSKQVEVLWFWAERPEDALVIVANDVVVVDKPNPYKHKLLPFARAVDVRRTHKFYGKGEAELLESVQDELNTLRRMIIDRNHLDIDKMFFVSSRLNLTDEDLIARPHGAIPVDDVNSSKAIEYNDIPRSVELSMKHLEDDATIVTGINPRAQALPTTGTATEAAILKESTLKRIRLKVKLLEQEFLVRVGELRVSNILQYYPQPKLEKIVGEKETEEFKQNMEELKAKGLIQTVEGEDYLKKFRQIRLENKELVPNERGTVGEKPIQGFSFFELKPEYFVPSSSHGFDIRFKAGSTLPISKPLMQSKAMEMYDRLVQLAVAGVGYDPVKLGDLLLKVNDYNPQDFHIEKAAPEESDKRLSMSIELANTENRILLQTKKPIPGVENGTPYAPPAHTEIHVAFTSSPEFEKLNPTDPTVQAFVQHIVGELTMQGQRQGGQGMGEMGARPESMDNQNPLANQKMSGTPVETNKAIPGLIQGGEQTPRAI